MEKVLFQAIQFSSIWPIDWTLWGAITPARVDQGAISPLNPDEHKPRDPKFLVLFLIVSLVCYPDLSSQMGFSVDFSFSGSMVVAEHSQFNSLKIPMDKNKTLAKNCKV